MQGIFRLSLTKVTGYFKLKPLDLYDFLKKIIFNEKNNFNFSGNYPVGM